MSVHDLQPTATIGVTLRYFAAARAAAGTETETLRIAQGVTVDQLIEQLRARGPELAAVLDRCSLLCDEIAVRDRSVLLQADQIVDVLPPFAGG